MEFVVYQLTEEHSCPLHEESAITVNMITAATLVDGNNVHQNEQ